jgi:hypothetical protein
MNEMSVSGRCLCGGVTYEVEGVPLQVRTCWCRVCQAVGAGSATVNVFVSTDALKVSGTLVDYQRRAASGTLMHRRFCPTCGVHMFVTADARPHITGVRAGTLADPEIARPEVTIWTSSAPSWACIADDIPQEMGQPAPKE